MDMSTYARRRLALLGVALTMCMSVAIFLRPSTRSSVPVGVTNDEYVQYASSTLGIAFQYPSTYRLEENFIDGEWATSTVALVEIQDQAYDARGELMRVPRSMRMYVSKDVAPEALLREQIAAIPSHVFTYDGGAFSETTIGGESALYYTHDEQVRFMGIGMRVDTVSYVLLAVSDADDDAAQRDIDTLLSSLTSKDLTDR